MYDLYKVRESDMLWCYYVVKIVIWDFDCYRLNKFAKYEEINPMISCYKPGMWSLEEKGISQSECV